MEYLKNPSIFFKSLANPNSTNSLKQQNQYNNLIFNYDYHMKYINNKSYPFMGLNNLGTIRFIKEKQDNLTKNDLKLDFDDLELDLELDFDDLELDFDDTINFDDSYFDDTINLYQTKHELTSKEEDICKITIENMNKSIINFKNKS